MSDIGIIEVPSGLPSAIDIGNDLTDQGYQRAINVSVTFMAIAGFIVLCFCVRWSYLWSTDRIPSTAPGSRASLTSDYFLRLRRRDDEARAQTGSMQTLPKYESMETHGPPAYIQAEGAEEFEMVELEPGAVITQEPEAILRSEPSIRNEPIVVFERRRRGSFDAISVAHIEYADADLPEYDDAILSNADTNLPDADPPNANSLKELDEGGDLGSQ